MNVTEGKALVGGRVARDGEEKEGKEGTDVHTAAAPHITVAVREVVIAVEAEAGRTTGRGAGGAGPGAAVVAAAGIAAG